MATEVVIADIVKVLSSDPAKLGQFDSIVTYRTADNKSYRVKVAGGQLGEAALITAIKADMAEREPLLGKALQIP